MSHILHISLAFTAHQTHAKQPINTTFSLVTKNLITTKLVVSKNKNLMKYCSHMVTYKFQCCNYFVSKTVFQLNDILAVQELFSSQAMIYKILYKKVNI
jgi:hypothetical protein